MLKTPFPYFGNKSRVAAAIWQRLGDVPNYLEPFAGSLAVLLQRPHPPHNEAVNDKNRFLANVFRAIQAAPDEVAHHADWPVNECDLLARHRWLVTHGRTLIAQLEDDPSYYDSQVAGWWLWGAGQWIGSDWCVSEQVAPKRPRIWRGGNGVHRTQLDLHRYMHALAQRLRRVRVCCGDWTRLVTPTLTYRMGLTAIFLDPPYDPRAGRDPDLYQEDGAELSRQVRHWCLETITHTRNGQVIYHGPRGHHPHLRIALCGLEGEHDMPAEWECFRWQTSGGYGNQRGSRGRNASRERIWFSPHCLQPQPSLFGW